MKSKLMMLILAGGLAFSAVAPSATAKAHGTLPPVNSPVAVSKAASKKASRAAQTKTAIPTKDNGKCTVAADRAVC
jgi:hypothetical protein